MQTSFSSAALADPATQVSEAIIRKCVHCGFCTATCPTYVLLGDELDSPRGRIYLIKDMLENERDPTEKVVRHIDRCLSCLSCMTTCPSGVNYMHLIDHARAYIEARYRRPLHERFFRSLLAAVLPYPRRFRLALQLARWARPVAPLAARFEAMKPLSTMLGLAPRTVAPKARNLSSAISTAKGRIVLLQGCAEPVLRPEIRDATMRLLNKAGYDVVLAKGEGCCGALVHHMGRTEASLEAARRNIDAWTQEMDRGPLVAVVTTAAGCGTAIKDYGFLLRNDPAYAERAAQLSARARDISELLAEIELPAIVARNVRIAYHAPCSLQHGQKVTDKPRLLLQQAGYDVHIPAEAHLCCGSAGTYNLLQPEIAGQLGDRKAASLGRLDAQVIATGNIGCATHLAQRMKTPIVHTVELLDWAYGGPPPIGLSSVQERILS